MHDHDRQVTGGVDTHGEVHVAAVIDGTGRILATSSFAATPAGYRGLLRWLRRHGHVVGVGVEASSGRCPRRRLNSGGDRQANNALWRIVLVRMSSDARTQAYVARRTLEGKSKREIIRCLKRHVAREMFRLLTRPATVPLGADLRAARLSGGLTLVVAAEALGTWPIRLSEIERGLAHNAELAHRYELWLRPDQAA